jgi:putative SOS response-associated peptidase YedK
MCGRYSLKESAAEIIRRFKVETAPTFETNDDIRPTNVVPIIRLNEAGANECVYAQWGLVPFWSKEPKLKFPTFNARAETIHRLPTFREAYKRRHCLVPVTSFFEWPILDGKKRKCRISMLDGSAFAFAGLWEHWLNKSQLGPPDITSFTIVTCEANEDMTPYHDRMPVILEQQHYEWWLDAEAENTRALLVPYLNGKLKIEPI